MEDDADEAEVEQHDLHADPPLSITGSCDDAVPRAMSSSWETHGARRTAARRFRFRRARRRLGRLRRAPHWTACRIGTTWPVLGHLTELGIECVAPAHKPGIVGVSAPKMRFGTSASPRIDDFRQSSRWTRRTRRRPKASRRRLRRPRASILPLGASLDVRTPVPLGDSPACVFASQAWAAPLRMWIAAGHGASSVVVKCEVPAAAKTDGALVVERGRVDSIRSATTTFSAFRDIPDCVVEDMSPESGGARGGVVSNVHASCLWRDGAAADARAGCLFGAIGPVAASAASTATRAFCGASSPRTLPRPYRSR